MSQVTAIIATTLRETLPAAVRSVVTQSIGDVELLLDDEPGGPAEARNRAAKSATSEWLAFLDDDETWLPDYLRILLAEAADASVAITNYFGQGGTEMTTDQIIALMAKGEAGFVGSGLAVRRDVFNAMGGFNEDLLYSSEYDFVLRAIHAGYRVKHIIQPGFRREVRRDDHLSHQLSGSELKAQRRAIFEEVVLCSE